MREKKTVNDHYDKLSYALAEAAGLAELLEMASRSDDIPASTASVVACRIEELMRTARQAAREVSEVLPHPMATVEHGAQIHA